MLDRVFAAVEHEAPPGEWRAAVDTVARCNRGMYAAHRWMAEVSTCRPPLGPGLMATYEHELRAFVGLGFGDVETDAALTFVLDQERLPDRGPCRRGGGGGCPGRGPQPGAGPRLRPGTGAGRSAVLVAARMDR